MITVGETFWSHVKKTANCWVWQRGTTTAGYGAFRDRETGKVILAHRHAWFLTNGTIPESMEIHHKCEFTLCVNPDHLELVTSESHPNTFRAENKAKKYCKHGHEFTEANTRLYKGKRCCRECNRLHSQKTNEAVRGY